MAGTKADELTPGQEAFALAYVESGNAARSYRIAYNKPETARDNWIYVEASQMLDHPKVSLRIKELQDKAAELSMYTVKAAFDELESARGMANETKNPSAAVSAVSAKIKLFGLDQPSRFNLNHSSPDGSMSTNKQNLNNLSDEELAQLELLTNKTRDPEGMGEAE